MDRQRVNIEEEGRARKARPSVIVVFCVLRTFYLPDPYYFYGTNWGVLGVLQRERVPWWKWLLLSLGVITAAVAVAMVGLVALIFHGVDFQDYLYIARPPWITKGWVGFWIAVIILSQSLAPVGGLALMRSARQVAFGGLRWPANAQAALLRMAAGAALAFTVQWVWHQVGPVHEDPYRLIERFVYAVAYGRSFWPWFWLLLTTVVVGPLAEEILYRGFVQSKLRERWGIWAGMLGSAILFGLAHGMVNALPAALLGLYFSYQVEKDRSLSGAVVLHALHNLATVLFMAFG